MDKSKQARMLAQAARTEAAPRTITEDKARAILTAILRDHGDFRPAAATYPESQLAAFALAFCKPEQVTGFDEQQRTAILVAAHRQLFAVLGS